jgi:ATP-binding cassette subfamily F protein 3
MVLDLARVLNEAPFSSLEDEVKIFLEDTLSEDGAITSVAELVELLAPYVFDASLMKDEAELQKACETFCTASGGFKPPSRKLDSGPPLLERSTTAMSAIPEDLEKTPNTKLAVRSVNGNENDQEQPFSARSSSSDGEKSKAKGKAKVDRRAKQRQAKQKGAAACSEKRGDGPTERDLSEIAAFGLQDTEEGLDAFDSACISGKGHLYLVKQAEKYRDIVLPAVFISIVSEFGQADLISGSPLRLMRGRKYGLIGRNGCGKTTLLRRIARRALPGLPPLRYGYVAQELTGSDESVLDVACAGDTEYHALLKERTRLEEALTNANSDEDTATLANDFSEICERLDIVHSFYGAEGLEGHARDVLLGLQFTSEMLKAPSKSLSGGWKMRLALAQALLSRADCLLLDEPTNHLDLVGVLWLQQYLQNKVSSDTILVMISHDRVFLDHVITDVVQIRHQQIEQMAGNYSSFKQAQEEEVKSIQSRLSAVENQEKKAKESLQKMKEQSQKKGKDVDPNKLRQAKERENKLFGKTSSSGEAQTYGRLALSSANGGSYKLTYAHHGIVDIHELAAEKLAADGPKVKMKLLEPEELDGVLLETAKADFKIGSRTILQKVKINIQPKSRIAIVGPNGAGKTTLLRLLQGEQWPENSGKRHRKLKIAHVTQNHLQDLEAHLGISCLEYFRRCLPDPEPGNDAALSNKSSDQSLIAYLANFALGPQTKLKVGALSGGQKARLAFAAQVWFRPNLLLLDEPTNHLDMDTLDELADALKSFAGACVIVSHNQDFLTTVCNELWLVENGKVISSGAGPDLFEAKFKEYKRAAVKKLKGR